ncbi:tetratricopeptide repeat protein [Geothrix sp. PMB-07]|uniref:tetratricopeptide repeat protein n=1 Tax=Geothrix sp. PMB-07 TaxID=3068640 RepID=UPI0027403A40|nr:tetratricopeptide repeat protein [Geothrix sp. PMB-07]WLT32196.1 tetratricopeptide repeat protein [Geothrix sp. PMB-07]
MNRNIMLALAGGLVAGFIAGYFVFSPSKDESAPVVAAPTTAVLPAPSLGGALPAAPAQGAMPLAPPSAEVQARIARIEAAVLADPKNHDAWAALGNEYFDSHQPQKAVDAYAKALALKPVDPNVLTDQGVMYRAMGQYDKALANFQKANKLDPTHVQSLFNIGVVYANDLNKPDEAAKAWNKILTTAPNSDQAAQARQMLSQLKK